MKIKLSDTPILAEFLKRLFERLEDIKETFDFKKDFELLSRCQCGQSDCATVYIKGKTDFKEEELGSYITNTNKGMICQH